MWVAPDADPYGVRVMRVSPRSALDRGRPSGTVRTVVPGPARWAVVLVAAVAVAWLPGGMFPFVLPKLAVVLVGVVLAACAPARGALPRGVGALLAAGGGWLVVSALAGESPATGLVGAFGRYEGVLALGSYAGALWVGARLLSDDEHGRTAGAWTTLDRACAAAALLVAAGALLEAGGLRPFAGEADERVGSLLGNATDMGAVAALLALVLVRPALALIPPATAGRPTPGARGRAPGDAWLAGAGLLAAVCAVVLSGSRAALLALVGGALVAGVAGTWLQRGASPSDERRWHASAGRVGWSGRPSGVRAVLVAVCAVGVLGALAVPTTAARLLGGDAAATASVSGRVLIWQRTLELAGDHPWLGVGPSGYAHAILALTDERWARDVGFTHPLDSPHAWPLQVLVVGGVPFALLAAALLVVLARAWWRRAKATADPWRHALATGGVVAVGLALLTHVTGAATLCLALLLVGALTAGPPRAVPAAARTAPAPGASPASGSAASLRAARRGVATAGGRDVAATSPGGRLAGDRVVRWAWGIAAGALAFVALVGARAEWPLRAAHDAAARGDAEAYSTACDSARTLRAWDRAVPSICAQDAAAALDARLGAEPAAESDVPLVAAATEMADRALATDPHDRGALGARAVLRQAADDLDGALADVERVLTLTPDDPAALLRAGALRAWSGDVDGAVADFEHVLRIDPGDERARTNLAILTTG